MKIAHIVCSYPPYYSGMGAVVLQTVQELASRGHEVEVLTPLYDTLPGALPDQFESSVQSQVDYATRYTPRVTYGNAAHIPQIEKELDRFDLVHLHYPFFGTANLVRKWKLRHPHKPLVVTYHMDTRAPGWKGLFFTYYNAFWMPKILENADLIIGSSEEYIRASDAAPLYEKRLHDRWKFLPFGVDLERFQPREKPQDLFIAAGFDINRPTLVFVGGMDKAHYFKGVDMLLKALLRLKQQGVFVQTLFVGDGDLRQEYQGTATAYGLRERVAFLGRVDDDLLPLVYNAADALVLPSTTRGEAFGMVLLEAYASGIPVIATDLPGVRTVAEHAGVVVPAQNYQALADAIAVFFSDDVDRYSLGHQAREIAKQTYAWPIIVDTLEEYYGSLVG